MPPFRQDGSDLPPFKIRPSNHETHFPAQQDQTRPHTRIPCPHGDEGRATGTQTPTRQGPRQADAVIATVAVLPNPKTPWIQEEPSGYRKTTGSRMLRLLIMYSSVPNVAVTICLRYFAAATNCRLPGSGSPFRKNTASWRSAEIASRELFANRSGSTRPNCVAWTSW